jgi:hypothetical protein
MAGWAWHYAAICRDFDGLVFISGFSCNERFMLGPPMIEDPKEPGRYIDDPNAPPMPDFRKLKIGASEIGITFSWHTARHTRDGLAYRMGNPGVQVTGRISLRARSAAAGFYILCFCRCSSSRRKSHIVQLVKFCQVVN